MSKSAPALPHRSFSNQVNDRATANPKSYQLFQLKGVGLRFKATILAIAMSALPVLGVGTAAYVVTSQLNRQKVEEVEQAIASNLQIQLTQLMAERFGDIQIMAGLDVLTDPKLREKASTEEITAVLSRFQKAYPLYNSIAVFDLNGNVIAQTKGERLDNHRNRSYIQEALRTNRPVISQPLISTTSGVFSVYVASPVKDQETGKIIGTIRARIAVKDLVSLIKRTDEQDGSSYYFSNATGEIFYGSQGNYVGQLTSSGAKAAANGDEKYQAKTLEAVFPAIATFKQEQQTGSRVARNQDTKAEQLVTYIPPITTEGLANLNWKIPKLNWSVVVATNTSTAFATQQQLLLILLLGTGLTAVAASAVAIYLANRAIRPILASAETVEKIGQGDLETRVIVQGDDELAVLGTNINRMADQIQTLLQTLKQNATQTRQQTEVLFKLSQNEALIQGDAKAAAIGFTEAIAQTLNIERVAIWLFNSDRTLLTCFDQYDQSLHQHSSDDVLWDRDLPDFFQALRSELLIAVENVNTHPLTQSVVFTQRTLSETVSMLCLPIRITAQTVGVIWCEHVHMPRVWQADEQSFVAAIANLAAIVLESDWMQQEVGHLLDVVSEAEEGNLAIQAKVGDRTISLAADTFNRLLERFAQVLHQVMDAAYQVSERTNQQKMLMQRVDNNAERQSQSVSQVLQLTELVEQAAHESAENVQVSSTTLQSTSKTVTEGQAAIDTLTREISTLQEGTDRMIQRMKTLGEFVGLADQFVQDQSQIAFVTQTLAMNASLVAARASEQRDPRQFIVVAREFDSIAEQVSKLAQQTSDGLVAIEQRSAQIHQVVSAVDLDVQGLGEMVQHFMQGVEQSNQVFNQVQAAMTTAVQVGEVVADSSQNIMTAAQSTATAMREIAELANQTTHLTQQTKSQFEQVDELSSQLLQSVQFFQLPPAPDKKADVTSSVNAIEPSPLMVARDRDPWDEG